MNNSKQNQQMDLSELARFALNEAQKLGASDAEASLARGFGLSVKARNQEVESIQHENDNSLHISFYLGKQRGSASSSDLREESIRSIVAAAKDIARYSSEDKCVGLADNAEVLDKLPDLDLSHPWDLQAGEAAELAIAAEKSALDNDPRIGGSEGSSVNSYLEHTTYANSNGILYQWQNTNHSMDCEVIAKEGKQMQCNGWYDSARNHNDLQAATAIGEMAAQRAVQRLSPQPYKSSSEDLVMFEAPVAKSIVSNLVRALSGGNLYRKSSFLLDRLGDKLFPEWVQISEQPHLRRALASAPVDAEGVPTKEKDVIKDGIIASYFLGSYAARRLGMQSTANAGGVHNLVVQPGKDDFRQMLKTMGNGLLITELMGTGTNLVTGDYSQGASGFLVENGEISHPVENISVAGNLQQIFSQLIAVGNDVDKRSYIHCGSMLFSGITVAGNN